MLLSVENINLKFGKRVILNNVSFKADSGKIRFILLKDLGNAYVDSTVTEKEIKDALNELCLDEAE